VAKTVLLMASANWHPLQASPTRQGPQSRACCRCTHAGPQDQEPPATHPRTGRRPCRGLGRGARGAPAGVMAGLLRHTRQPRQARFPCPRSSLQPSHVTAPPPPPPPLPPRTLYHVVAADFVDVGEQRVVGIGQLVGQVGERDVGVDPPRDHGVQAVVGDLVELAAGLVAGVLLLAEAAGGGAGRGCSLCTGMRVRGGGRAQEWARARGRHGRRRPPRRPSADPLGGAEEEVGERAGGEGAGGRVGVERALGVDVGDRAAVEQGVVLMGRV
jgi:hypothetical protein